MIREEIYGVIERKGLTLAKAAEKCGMHHQQLWQALNNRHPRYRTVERMMSSLGMMIKVTSPGSDPDELVKVLRKTDLDYDKVVEIVRTMGGDISWEWPESSEKSES